MKTGKNPSLRRGIIFLLSLKVMRRRVKVANLLHKKKPLELYVSGNHYVQKISSEPLIFTNPQPPLASIAAELTAFAVLIAAAQSGDRFKIQLRKAKHRTILNLLATLSRHVESVANRPQHVTTGAATIFQKAGMRPKDYKPRNKQNALLVIPGSQQGTLECIAESLNGKGTHRWQYRLTHGDPNQWTEVNGSTVAKIIIAGLTRGDMITVRHCAITNKGTTDWEVYEGVVVR
jgi:hypothetical protein